MCSKRKKLGEKYLLLQLVYPAALTLSTRSSAQLMSSRGIIRIKSILSHSKRIHSRSMNHQVKKQKSSSHQTIIPLEYKIAAIICIII